MSITMPERETEGDVEKITKKKLFRRKYEQLSEREKRLLATLLKEPIFREIRLKNLTIN
jgi:hypothetical protein